MSATMPPRLSVPLPRSTMRPRIGKVRLGEKRSVEKNGRTILYPSKLPYFRVDADESGITTAETAAAFHDVYGDQPTQLRAMLPGHQPEDVFEGAWRLYGSSKLKRRCDGTTCTQRTATGGWDEAPCICQTLPEKVTRNDKEVPNPDRCQLGYTLQVILPDVDGVGIWEVTTGSAISARQVTDWLYMVYELTGSLAFVEFDLHLTEKKVSPAELGGKSSTVYVLDPRLRGYTPRQVLAGEAAPQRRLQLANGQPRDDLPALPPSSLDEERDDLIDPDDEATMVADEIEAEAEVVGETIEERVARMLEGIDDGEKVKLSVLARRAGVKPTRNGLIEAYGDQADDLVYVRHAIAEKLLADFEGDAEAACNGIDPMEFDAWLQGEED